MSLHPPPVHAPSKAITNPLSQSSSSTQSQSHSSSSADFPAQRRSGGSGSFGAGSTARNNLASPRNGQSSKKHHKTSKRSRFADEDALAESAAMKSTNSRKGQTSITHLMTFSLPPRPQPNQASYHHNRHGRRNPTWGLGSGYHRVDKARYVHANYRFLVDSRGDYRAQAVDADIHLDWNSILQILASAQTQCAACPICLSTPVAPRMAKCGHIFCLPCLIRYMHSTDDSKPIPEKRARWKKCPICWDSVYAAETKPVRWFTGQEGPPPREGEDIVLRLVMRQPGSTLALPRDGSKVLEKAEDIPWHFATEVADYARVMKASEDDMMAQYDAEIEQLRLQEREDELIYGDEPEWTKKAMTAIREAKEKVKGIGNPPSMPKQAPGPIPKRPPIQFNDSTDGVPEMYLFQHASRSGQSSSGGASTPQDGILLQPQNESTESSSSDSKDHASADPHGHPVSASNMPPSTASLRGKPHEKHSQPSDSPYYFYQALLHYYLSPLDIRILKSAFGEFSSFPSSILPRVEHVSTGHIIDDDLRKRTKYLAHLPYGCEIGFLQCDWTDIVSADVLKRFESEIESRRRRNKEKETREEKERVRAEKEEEDKRWAAARRKRPSVSRDNPNDSFRPPSSAIAEIAHPSSSSSLPDASRMSASPPWSSTTRNHSGSAFASLASPSTSPVAARTVWGTTAVVASATSPPLGPDHREPDISDNDGWLQGWETDLLRDDDELVAQIEAASLTSGAPGTVKNGAVQGAAAATGGKKKKGRKITLMSTNARRGA
ncbi:MAG: hypothetical protein M1817_004462 [Caeruleum heppii]|nr:MAG: hypothetical protein M1817_004462 [Caeruleum heppii]